MGGTEAKCENQVKENSRLSDKNDIMISYNLYKFVTIFYFKYDLYIQLSYVQHGRLPYGSSKNGNFTRNIS